VALGTPVKVKAAVVAILAPVGAIAAGAAGIVDVLKFKLALYAL
jgi:hypothetical protein